MSFHFFLKCHPLRHWMTMRLHFEPRPVGSVESRRHSYQDNSITCISRRAMFLFDSCQFNQRLWIMFLHQFKFQREKGTIASKRIFILGNGSIKDLRRVTIHMGGMGPKHANYVETGRPKYDGVSIVLTGSVTMSPNGCRAISVNLISFRLRVVKFEQKKQDFN